MFKRMLSSMGIGSAKVDTIVEADRFAPGDTVDVTVKIMGGNTEQQIDGLYFSILSNYKTSLEYKGEERTVTETAVLENLKLSDSFVIGPGETEDIPLSFDLPFYTPLTLKKTRVWINTGLDIKMAKDPADRDYIEIVPGELVESLFDSLEQLGFGLADVECEESSAFRDVPFVQEFEFKPVGGPFRGKLDELEIVCFPKNNHVEVFMEIDRKSKGLGGFFAKMAGTDESRVKFSFDTGQIPDLTNMIQGIIEDHS